MKRGYFISFEGCDGCGKSTQIAACVDRLKNQGIQVVQAREPGSTAVGEKIRSLLLDPAHSEMSSTCELLLYEAARAQLVDELIRPALERGTWVVLDRYADSTWAYQKGGRGLSPELVRTANELGTEGLWPDLTIFLSLNPELSLLRADSDHQPDRLELEGAPFQDNVHAAYVELTKTDAERVVALDATGSIDEVSARVWNVIESRFL